MHVLHVSAFFSSLVPITLGYLFKLRELVRKSGWIKIQFSPVMILAIDLVLTLSSMM